MVSLNISASPPIRERVGTGVAVDLSTEDKIVVDEIVRVPRSDQIRVVERGDAVHPDTAPGDLLQPDVHVRLIPPVATQEILEARIDAVEKLKLQLVAVRFDLRVLFLPQHAVEPTGNFGIRKTVEGLWDEIEGITAIPHRHDQGRKNIVLLPCDQFRQRRALLGVVSIKNGSRQLLNLLVGKWGGMSQTRQ